MADSTARDYRYLNALPKYAEPERKVEVSPLPSNTRVAYNALEKGIIALGGIITMALMVILVSINVSTTNAQRSLQNVNTEVNKVNTYNSYLRQEIGELTSNKRMTKIAKDQGLSLNEANIRTVK